jgi:HK97 family phage portal protein
MSLFRNNETRDAGTWEPLRAFDTGGSSNAINGASLDNALSLIPLYSATSLIADTLSILPLHGYRDLARLDPQPGLCTSPHVNPLFTRAEWVHQFATSWLLRGNAYGVVTAIDNYGTPTKIMWLNPDGIHIDEQGTRVNPGPIYFYGDKELDKSTLIHIPWYPKPGSIQGLSPVALFKLQIETGLQANRYGRNWFRNGSMPSGHLKYAQGILSPEDASTAKNRFKAAVANNDVFVSGKDWDWTVMAVKPEEAQFLQTIKASANQMAAIYKVAPEDIGGETGHSLTYATVELNQIKFQVRALQPIFTRLEMHINRLLPGKQYVKFNPDAIVRTDLLTRMQAHRIALDTGMETHEEGRALEDRKPLTRAEWTAYEKYKKLSGKVPAEPAAASEDKGGADNA